MSNLSRQVSDIDVGTLITVIWLLVIIGVVYWFYNFMKRIERILTDIKKSLESKPSTAP
jgi:hypothetical protein